MYSDDLLDEVAGLVEWPVAITGSFDPEFLRLPEEVLIATLQGHQRYFPIRDAAGRLMPRFITTANLESRDPDQVRQGNERVILPRLSDAAFFWDQDRKSPLAARVRAARHRRVPAGTRQPARPLPARGDARRRNRRRAGRMTPPSWSARPSWPRRTC